MSLPRLPTEGKVSNAELAKMMVSMEIGKPHPIFLRHGTEVRMILRPDEIAWPPADAIEKFAQFALVFLEFHGCSSANLLIQFRSGRESMRPVDRDPKGYPAKHRTGIRDGRGLYWLLADEHAIGVAEVTDHLVRRHLAPLPSAVRLDRLQPLEDLRLVFWSRERFHRLNLLRRISRDLSLPALKLLRREALPFYRQDSGKMDSC